MTRRISKLAAPVSVATSLLLGVSQNAFAQSTRSDGGADSSADAGGLSEIIITATRRETGVQETPLTVTAISGEALRNSGVVNPRDLSSLAPSLNVDQGITNGQTHVSIRGIASTDFGAGSNSPVAINIDDVYQPFQFGIATQVFDLNRIEVLRGPQGTLFGKNTTSGALNYYSQTPVQRQEGYLLLDGGSGDFNHYALEGAYNTPLTDQLAVRASVRVDRREDYVDNLFDGSKLGGYTNYNGRLQLAWVPSDETNVNLKLFGVKSEGDGPIYVAQYRSDPCQLPPGVFFNFPRSYLCVDGVNASPDSPDSRHVNSEVPTFEDYYNYGAVVRVEHRIGDYSLTSITGYQKGQNKIDTNDDGLAGDAFHSFQGSDTSQFSQELRLATPASARLRAVVGVFGQHDKITTDQGSTSSQIDPNGPFPGYDYYTGSLGSQKGDSLAAFTSTTYDVTSRFSLVGGLRYSYEKKKVGVNFLGINGGGGGYRGLDLLVDDNSYKTVVSRYGIDPTVDAVLDYTDEHSWTKLTWDATANFKPTDDSLLYARVASGFRSGGYSIGITGTDAYDPTKPALDPETVTSYELGFKSEWLDHRLRINGATYWTDYKDMQVQLVNTSGTGSRLTNAARSRIKGAELEVEAALTKALRLFASAGYNHARFSDYVTVDPNRPRNGNANGNALPYAPDWTANAGGSYEVPVGDSRSVVLSTNWTYRSRIYFDAFQEQLSSDEARTVGSARVSYGSVDKGWRIAAYVDNLTDEDMRVFVFPFGGLQQPNTFLIAPAIYAPKRTWGAQVSFDF